MKILILALLLMSGCTQPGYTKEVPRIVRIAQAELGKGEQGGDNKGKEVKKYTKGKEVAWCAGFVSWVRFQAGQRDNYFLCARSYWEEYHNERVVSPIPGDLIVFARGTNSGHVGIVESVQADRLTTLEGNVGKYPAVVKRFTYKLGHIKNLLGFVRV